MQSGTVIAVNGKGRRRTFTRPAWDLLGKNKEGWNEVASEEISDVKLIAPLVKPPTGTKPQPAPQTQKIENVLKNQAQNSDNAPGTVAKINFENAIDEFAAAEELEQKKQTFFRAATGTKAGVIKDYFDSQTPSIIYEKSAKVNQLIAQLGELLEWDTTKFQKMFS